MTKEPLANPCLTGGGVQFSERPTFNIERPQIMNVYACKNIRIG
jgi:hypothetical protein